MISFILLFVIQGVLRINVVEARDLIKQDIGGKSDPYCVVSIGTQQFRTRTIYNTLNPIWNYVCEVNLLTKLLSKYYQNNLNIICINIQGLH